MKKLTTWRDMIAEEMKEHGETWGDIQSSVGEEYFDRPFYAGFGAEEGDPFTVWTNKRVYFPACYDGAEWCASVSRNPDEVATAHIG